MRFGFQREVRDQRIEFELSKLRAGFQIPDRGEQFESQISEQEPGLGFRNSDFNVKFEQVNRL